MEEPNTNKEDIKKANILTDETFDKFAKHLIELVRENERLKATIKEQQEHIADLELRLADSEYVEEEVTATLQKIDYAINSTDDYIWDTLKRGTGYIRRATHRPPVLPPGYKKNKKYKRDEIDRRDDRNIRGRRDERDREYDDERNEKPRWFRWFNKPLDSAEDSALDNAEDRPSNIPFKRYRQSFYDEGMQLNPTFKNEASNTYSHLQDSSGLLDNNEEDKDTYSFE